MPEEFQPPVHPPGFISSDPVVQAQWDERLKALRGGAPSILEMMEVLADVSHETVIHQHAYIEALWIVQPNPKAIRREFVMRQVIDLLQRVQDHADRVRPILYPSRSEAKRR